MSLQICLFSIIILYLNCFEIFFKLKAENVETLNKCVKRIIILDWEKLPEIIMC